MKQLERLTLPTQACRLGVLKQLPKLQSISHPRFGENLPAAEFIKLSDASDLAWTKVAPELAKSDAKDLRPDRLTVREAGKVDLDMRGTQIRDLKPLARFHIHRLLLDTPPPGLDLGPLGNKPDLLHLSLVGAAATDLLPLLPGSKLESFAVNRVSRNVNLLSKHPTLKNVGYRFDEKLLRPPTTVTEFFSPRVKDDTDPDEKSLAGLLVSQHFDNLDEGAAGWVCEHVESQTDSGFWMADPPSSKGRGGGCFGTYYSNGGEMAEYFKAPAMFLGDKSQAYGGGLEIRIKQRDVDYDSSAPDVEIASGTLKLVVTRARPSVLGWQTLLIPLKVDSGWRIGDLNGSPATREDFQKVLAKLESIRIRAKLNSRGGGWTNIDDIGLWDKSGFENRELTLSEQNADTEKSMEWGDRATIVTSGNLGFHHLENHAKVFLRNGIAWAEKLGEHKGVAIVHPIDGSKPATITIPVPNPLLKGSKLEIVACGSTVRPGNLVRVLSGGKVLRTEDVEDKWETIQVLLDECESDQTELKIEIHAKGWYNEYCYLDTVRILDPTGNSDPP